MLWPNHYYHSIAANGTKGMLIGRLYPFPVDRLLYLVSNWFTFLAIIECLYRRHQRKPTTSGTYSFTGSDDSLGNTATQSLSIKVN